MKTKLIAGIALIICGVLLGSYFAYGLTTSLLLHSTGNVSMLAAYSDAGATHAISTIDWANVFPGYSYNQTIYLKNMGATALNVSLNPSNWNPSNATNYMKLTWDREGYTLTAGFTVGCTLTLQVYANITDPVSGMGVGTFSTDLVFTGTQ